MSEMLREVLRTQLEKKLAQRQQLNGAQLSTMSQQSLRLPERSTVHQLPTTQHSSRTPRSTGTLQSFGTIQSSGTQQTPNVPPGLEASQASRAQQTAGRFGSPGQTQPPAAPKLFRYIAAGKGGKFPLRDGRSLIQGIGSTDRRDHIGVYYQVDLWTIFVASIKVPRWESNHQPGETRTEFCKSIAHEVRKRLSQRVGVFHVDENTNTHDQTVLDSDLKSTLKIFCDDIRELGNDAAITGIFQWAGISGEFQRRSALVLMARFIKETPGDGINDNFRIFIGPPPSNDWYPVDAEGAENVWTIE